jgi:heat shock protein HslJ
MIRRSVLTALSALAASALWPGQSPATSEPFAALTAGSWRIDLIDGAETSPSGAGDFPVLTILEDGRLAGSSGCNRFMGRITVRPGGRVEIGPIASTRMACPEPLMAQERALFDALEAAEFAGLATGGALRMLAGSHVLVHGTPIPDPG